MGIPFPGETTLLAAAPHAGALHGSGAAGMIAAAAFGAILWRMVTIGEVPHGVALRAAT